MRKEGKKMAKEARIEITDERKWGNGRNEDGSKDGPKLSKLRAKIGLTYVMKL